MTGVKGLWLVSGDCDWCQGNVTGVRGWCDCCQGTMSGLRGFQLVSGQRQLW